jgi:hypothetical protein
MAQRGLIALLAGRQPATGGLSIPMWGGIMGVITLSGVALALRSLLRLPRWREQAQTAPLGRLLPGVGWSFAPALLLLALPWLVAQGAGRVFSYIQLARSMPEIIIWLGLCAGLGSLNRTAGIVMLFSDRLGKAARLNQKEDSYERTVDSKWISES